MLPTMSRLRRYRFLPAVTALALPLLAATCRGSDPRSGDPPTTGKSPAATGERLARAEDSARESASKPAADRDVPKQTASEQIERAAKAHLASFRARHKLGSLVFDPRISVVARAHSSQMAQGKVRPGHQGMEQRLDALARQIPMLAAAENVGWNRGHSDPARTVVEGWEESPGHRKNVLGDYDRAGLGAARGDDGTWYFTLILLHTTK